MLIVEGKPATRHDHMHMRMVGQRRSPGVKHGRHADPCAEMLGSAAIVSSVSGVALEEAVKHGLVLMGDGADGRRKREDNMIIGHGQKLGFALSEPLARRGPLTLRTMPVAAGVVGDVHVIAIFAARDMTAKCCRAAGFDR